MPTLGQPDGEEERAQDSATGAMPEGARIDAGSPSGPARRDSVPPLQSEQAGAGDLEKPPLPADRYSAVGLDFLVEMDEPLELAIALRKVSERHLNNPSWGAVTRSMIDLIRDLKAINEPPRRE